MYKLLSDGVIFRVADGSSIPPDPGNRDYRRYLAWLAEGNAPRPADPLPPSEAPRRDAALTKLRDLASGAGPVAELAQAFLDLR